MPRVGFSYDLTGNGKTVLRGGFGTFFERMQGNDVYNIATAAPFSNTPSLNNVAFANPFLELADRCNIVFGPACRSCRKA